ncbi:bacteriocin [Dysgonomonas sp. 521]|uniref:bacteriocin n=1 Tax=Dysgonomonas sp. 521 TaxID=2302932 RepID=UPI0013D4DF55|nr:bacteriocin [Dysgonomonas sp. 521]NDV94362.1 bacteriocin [Dysgonomonas sp. 521]
MKNLDLTTLNLTELNDEQLQKVEGGAKEWLLHAAAISCITPGLGPVAGLFILGVYNGYNA